MLEPVDNLPAGIDGLRAVGTVTKEDYDRVVQPLLNDAWREGRRVRFLYQFGHEFTGFSAGGAWEDAHVGVRYLRLFERCAVVSDIGWIRQSSRAMGAVMPCPVKVFGNAQLSDAIAWLAQPTAARALTYRMIPEQGVLIIEPHDRLGPEDFDAVARVVDPWIESAGELRGLVIHARAFPGWQSLGSFFRHIGFVREHHRKIRRVALVADGKLAELVPKIVEHFVQAEIRRFDYDDLDSAIAWTAGAPVAAGPSSPQPAGSGRR